MVNIRFRGFKFMLQTKQMICSICRGDFPFSTEEQIFYNEKGFSNPKKCKPCRQKAKKARRKNSGFNNEGDGEQRPLFDTVCSACGIGTQVPFKPDEQKPVYCRDCYRSNAY